MLDQHISQNQKKKKMLDLFSLFFGLCCCCCCCILTAAATTETPSRGRCTINVVPNLSPSDFLQHYYLQRPVIIPNLKTPIKTKQLWKLTHLVKMYGHVDVATGSSTDLTKSRGSGKSTMKLKTFVQNLRSHQGKAEIFAFERNPAIFEQAPELKISANKIPRKYTKQMNRSDIQASDWYLSVGSRHSGVHAHHHSDGWAYLFAGKKRWFFWRPRESLPSFTHVARFPMRDWYNEYVYPKLQVKELPYECAAVRGDFVYVPEGWWHSTLAESDITISIAAQSRVPVTLPGKQWREAVDKWWSEGEIQKNRQTRSKSFVRNMMARTLERLEKIQAEQSNNAEAFHFGGTVMARINALQGKKVTWNATLKELKMKERAYELSPRNCDCLHNYGVSLAKARRLKKSVKMLQRAVELCGGFQKHLKGSLESIKRILAAQQQPQSGAQRERGGQDL